MRKKVIFTSALALALMVSPLGSLNVSAEEITYASGESRAASSSEKVVLGTPFDLQLSENLDKCTFKYPVGNSYGRFFTHIWVYRDDTLVHEYQTLGDNSVPGWVYVHYGSSGYCSFDIPLYQYDMAESGSYSFKVRMEAQWPDSLAVSETVTSEPVEYTRPEQTLGTTVGHWDTTKEGRFRFEAVEGAAGYEFRLYKQDEDSGEWHSCILNTPTDGLVASPGHESVYSTITSDSPRDNGNEVLIRDFSGDIFNNNYNTPAGRYCVTVQALSNNRSEIANGPEGAISAVLEVTDKTVSDNPDMTEDSEQTEDAGQPGVSTIEELIDGAQPGEVISTQGITTLSNGEMKLLLERNVTLEMSYTYEGVDYSIRIPAGAAVNNDIEWYGPLYLAQYYRVGSFGNKVPTTSVPSYTVQAGDTLGKIARANNMTLAELTAKNPQIKNADLIMPGQTIQIK